ncbi:APC family permease [Chloroflexota bacterium]
MSNSWQPKPGDSIFRPRRIKRFRLRRVLGIPALFSAGYGNVGSSIYYALGIVALVALGATPIVLAIAGILFIFNALTYAEGTAMLPEAGGSFSFARHAFNDTISFIAGWALMLSYIVTMAISAYTIPPYLSHFWPMLDEPVASTGFSIGVIFLLMVLNVVGIKESSRVNIVFIILDIVTQVTLVLLGIFLILIVNPSVLVQNMFGEGNWPNTQDLIYGIAIAALCFTGVETVSQLAEETRQPQRRIPQAYFLMIGAVIVLFAGISIVALSAMTPQVLGDPINGWARDPVAGIAANLPSEMLQNIFSPLVAVLAASILLTAANAGLIGISRLAFSMSSHKHIPEALSRIHPHFRTPYIAIILFCIVAFLLLIPGFFNPQFFTDLGALYVFGSLLSFGLAQAAIVTLRIKKPELARPFKISPNIRFREKELPLITILAFIGTVAVWLVVLITQGWSRWVGIGWVLIGLVIYYFFKQKQASSSAPSEDEPVKSD